MENNSFLQTNHPTYKYLGCTSILKNVKHFVIPGLNLADKDFLGEEISSGTASDYYKPPLLNIDRPIPCLSPEYVDEQDNPKEDPILKLVRKKYFWKRKKRQLQITVDRLINRPVLFPQLIDTVKKDESNTKLPYAVVRMSDHLANNPDKFFKGMYQWYYGNAMKELTINGDHYLLYANGKDLNELCMTFITKPRKSQIVPKLIPQVRISLPESGFIYDVIGNDLSKTIAVRQRNSCSFLNYYEDHDGIISFKNFLTLKNNEYPFRAMDNNNLEFCTIDANRMIQFWHPEYLKHCVEYTNLPENNTKLPDGFIQVKYDSNHSSQIFVVIDRYNVYFYDRRESYKEPCSHLKPNKQTEECEDMSVLIPSIREKTWYLGMSHSCLLLDTRMGFAEKWTHMLTQPPSIGYSFRLNEESYPFEESVILATQNTNEIVAVYNTESESKVTYSPVSVPTRRDTFQEARMDGILTNLHLHNKFSHSIIGLTAYKMKKHTGIFSLISTGDIFYQKVKYNTDVFDKNTTCLNEEELNYLENWEYKFHIKNLTQKRNLTISRNVDFSELVNSIDESIEIPPWSTHTLPKKAHWKLSIKNLQSYRDMLAPYILDEYGVDDIENWSSDESEIDPLMDNSEKVQTWLSGKKDASESSHVPEVVKNDDSTHLFAISNLQEDEASVLDPIIELNVNVPPKYDLEVLSKPKAKRRRRR